MHVRRDAVANVLATPGNNDAYTYNVAVDNLLARIMQAATLTQEYTASLQEGALPVLGGYKGNGMGRVAAGEWLQTAYV